MTFSSSVPRVGIIGLGGFGAFHTEALLGLEREGLCRLVGGCDPNLDAVRARAAGALDQRRLFRTIEELLDWGEMDYVLITTPPHLHQEHTTMALDRGLFVMLEKPPVPIYGQLDELLRHPGAGRVAVGFQLLETAPIRALKAKLVAGELGAIREITASGLWPRPTSYYDRAAWAGRMRAGDRPVFDGPLTNALAHIVHNVFYLAGREESAFATPRTVSGFLARARPIESYDFGWVRGETGEGIPYQIVAAHCSEQAISWRVTVRTDRGLHHIGEADLTPAIEMLGASHRTALAACQGRGRATTTLADCLGYSMATTGGLISSGGIHAIPAAEIRTVGEGADTIYDVAQVHRLIAAGQRENAFAPDAVPWLKPGETLDCRAALATPSPLFG